MIHLYGYAYQSSIKDDRIVYSRAYTDGFSDSSIFNSDYGELRSYIFTELRFKRRSCQGDEIKTLINKPKQ
jgi:hypothetical protein